MRAIVWRGFRPARVILLAIPLMAILAAAGYAAMLYWSGNFHVVIRGELYRAAQPTAQRIADLSARYGIRTIVNLRGANPGSPWYDEEAQAAASAGIRLINFEMSAQDELTPARADWILAILRAAPKPILIHCESGADRSGLVAALYVAAVAKLPEARAEAQISLRYGHISLWFVPSYAMDRSFERYEPRLGFLHS